MTQYQITSEGILLPFFPDFDLEQTLCCGQCFRWARTERGFFGIAMGKTLSLSLEKDGILFEGIKEREFHKIWVPYFDLEQDYGEIRRALSQVHPVLKEAAAYAPGIRILRQDPWETLCTFIISQNNNIPRIQGIISRLCACFGERCGETFLFPSPERLSTLSVEDLAPIRCGFRAKYLLDAARRVVSGQLPLEQLRKLPLPQARQELMSVYGVGKKVADCVLLYGLHRLDAFPLDVWMNRAMEVLFPNIGPEDFGPFAGIAQQYIFHYSRRHPELFPQKNRESRSA